jgi:hypothetical protein
MKIQSDDAKEKLKIGKASSTNEFKAPRMDKKEGAALAEKLKVLLSKAEGEMFVTNDDNGMLRTT